MVKASFLIEFENEHEVFLFNKWLEGERAIVKNLTVLPDSSWLYDTNETFRALVKEVKKAKNAKDEYYNNQKLKR